MTNPTTTIGNSSKRGSLSINVHSAGAGTGPRPLQLGSSPLTSRSSSGHEDVVHSAPEAVDSHPLPTPPPTTNHAERLKRQARRQSSISYNPSSPNRATPRRTNSVGPLSPTWIPSPLSTPSRDSTPSPALRERSDREPLLLELHSSLLAQIAQREERSLELRALLKANEEELETLKRKWAQVVLASSSAPPTPVMPAQAARNQNQPPVIPNIADPFYGLSSPSLDVLREGAKKFLSSLTNASAPSPTAGPEPVRIKQPPMLKRRVSRENRDSSSSTGSSVMSSASESVSTRATSVCDEDEAAHHSDEETCPNGSPAIATSTSLSRNGSLNGNTSARRRSGQGTSTTRPGSASSSVPPSSFPSSPMTTSTKDKRNSLSTPLPGLGLAGVVGGLFSSDSSVATSPLTLTPKRNSTPALSSSVSSKRKSSILGGFTWNEMLAPSSAPGSSPTPKQGVSSISPKQDKEHNRRPDEWNW